MQIYFHSRLCSYFSRVPILVEGTVYIYIYIYNPFRFLNHRSDDFSDKQDTRKKYI